MKPNQSAEKDTTNHQGADDGSAHHLSMIAELEHRIHELELLEHHKFGEFTKLDWFFCIAGSFLLPYLCYLWFWP